ncbi:MAG: hypothetical protein K9H11_13505, partial [Rhodospirillum sp.]|nr:hypothetical protein [Rhodospirillum sp.]
MAGNRNRPGEGAQAGPVGRRMGAAHPTVALTLGLAPGASLGGEAQAQERPSELGSETAFRVCADPANKPMSAEDG